MLIYLAGPYSATNRADVMLNVHKAKLAGLDLMRKGHTPLVPHLSHYLDLEARAVQRWDISWEEWMEHCFCWLDRCDALLYLSPSKGADMEKEYAELKGIPVYFKMDEVPDAIPLAESA